MRQEKQGTVRARSRTRFGPKLEVHTRGRAVGGPARTHHDQILGEYVRMRGDWLRFSWNYPSARNDGTTGLW